MPEKISVIILAAGLGKRLGRDVPKALVKTREKSLIFHILDAITPLEPENVIVVVGHMKEQVISQITSNYQSLAVKFANQDEQLGTGHAVKCALSEFNDISEKILVLCADTPLLETETLQALSELHDKSKATLSFLTLKAASANTYGRILREDGKLKEIKEHKDCSPLEKLCDETNPAVYMVDSAFLKPAVEGLENNNKQKEFYLTDIVARAVNEGQTVETLTLTNEKEFQGVNTESDLATVNKELSKRKVKELALEGVIFEDPDSVYIDSSVRIGKKTIIGPNVKLLEKTTISSDVQIEGNACFINTNIETGTFIRIGCRAEDVFIGKNCTIGPFVNLRPKTEISNNVRIGNFIETKNVKIGNDSKLPHLSYIGDAEIGKDVNIGAGTITANYDGVNKHKTTILDSASTGANSSLVAPITIGKNAYIAAGSVITKDVPNDALSVARGRQKNVEGWASKSKK